MTIYLGHMVFILEHNLSNNPVHLNHDCVVDICWLLLPAFYALITWLFLPRAPIWGSHVIPEKQVLPVLTEVPFDLG